MPASFNPRSIMLAAWSNYRRLWGSETFSRRRFGNCLRAAWRDVKRERSTMAHVQAVEAARAARRAADPAAADREDRIEAAQLLSSRYRIAPMVAAIRAEAFATV